MGKERFLTRLDTPAIKITIESNVLLAQGCATLLSYCIFDSSEHKRNNGCVLTITVC